MNAALQPASSTTSEAVATAAAAVIEAVRTLELTLGRSATVTLEKFYPTTIALADLPRIGETLFDGVFAGIVRGDKHDVAIFDVGSPDKRMNHADAAAWAKSLGASLATREEGRLLSATIDLPSKRSDSGYFWLETQYEGGADCAWFQAFGVGGQIFGRKDDECRARAVRRLAIQ